MTIKEEIEGVLFEVYSDGNNHVYFNEKKTIEQILKFFEKLIDEKIADLNDRDTLYSGVIQRIAVLKELKEELKN